MRVASVILLAIGLLGSQSALAQNYDMSADYWPDPLDPKVQTLHGKITDQISVSVLDIPEGEDFGDVVGAVVTTIETSQGTVNVFGKCPNLGKGDKVVIWAQEKDTPYARHPMKGTVIYPRLAINSCHRCPNEN